MKNKLVYMLRWDDRPSLVVSILFVAILVHKGQPGLAIIFGTIFVFAHIVLLALSRSISRYESQQVKK